MLTKQRQCVLRKTYGYFVGGRRANQRGARELERNLQSRDEYEVWIRLQESQALDRRGRGDALHGKRKAQSWRAPQSAVDGRPQSDGGVSLRDTDSFVRHMPIPLRRG